MPRKQAWELRLPQPFAPSSGVRPVFGLLCKSKSAAGLRDQGQTDQRPIPPQPSSRAQRKPPLPIRPPEPCLDIEDETMKAIPYIREAADEQTARQLQAEFDQEVRDKVDSASFSCPICLEKNIFEKSVQLDCQHRICLDCFQQYLEDKIQQKMVATDELICPMPSCGIEITVPQVEGVMCKTPMWERFLQSRIQIWRPRSGENEKLCTCPSNSCAASFVVPTDMEEEQVKCPHCGVTFCISCGISHPDESCEDVRRRRENDANEHAFNQLCQQQQWQRCPACTAPVERNSGCNYMTCYSETCRGKTRFCYLCGVELARLDHVAHFPAGPFENKCQNEDKTEDSTLLRTNLRDTLRQDWIGLVDNVSRWTRTHLGQVPLPQNFQHEEQ